MRFVAAAAFLAAMSCGAHASSFEVIGDEAPASTPSIEVMGDAPSIEVIGDATDGTELSPSVIALGPPPDKVVEVAKTETRAPPPATTNFGGVPYVIRAGIEGDAFVRATSAPDTTAPKIVEKKRAPLPPGPETAGTSSKDADTKPETDPLDSKTKLR